MELVRVAIIGAGPSGLAQLHAFSQIPTSDSTRYEVICFEGQADWGGMWNYDWRTGIDESGEPIHGGMYRHLWSNGPKETIEFADYGFDTHFGYAIPSYPPRAVIRDYLIGRAIQSGVRESIHFQTTVRSISYCPKHSKFTITYIDKITDVTASDVFDYVVVATGHFSVPTTPHLSGIESFPGRILHAHDFREASQFQSMRLLIVGSSYSAEDIGIQCYKYGASKITFCYKNQGMPFKWPSVFEQRHLPSEIEGRTVRYSDGHATEIDAIIFCTGYKHHFPFLEDELRLRTKNCLYPINLYKGVAWLQNPRLFYIGMQDLYYSFTLFDIQAVFARNVITGHARLPDWIDMAKDINNWQSRQTRRLSPFEAIDYQTEYLRDLTQVTEYRGLDLDHIAAVFKEWERDKMLDILSYRDNSYESALTGKISPRRRVRWMDTYDDSTESFLDQGSYIPETMSTAETEPSGTGLRD